MKRHQLFLSVGSTALLLLASCSSDSPAGLPDGGAGTTASSSVDQQAAGDTTVASNPAGTAGTGDTAAGSCHVKVTGDVTSEWTTAGGSGTVGYGPWVEMPDVTTVMGPVDETFFIINCQDLDDDYVGFLSANEAAIPMQPASYTMTPTATLLGGSTDDKVTTLITFQGSDTIWVLSAPGQLIITEFDDQHIAGTFSLPVKDGMAELNGVDEGAALITGEFDFANPN